MRRKVVAGQPLNLRESEEQENGVAFLKKIGFQVGVTTNRRATSNSPGIPDVIAVGHGIVLQWEAKAEGGRLSPEQQAWGAACRENIVPWVAGTFAALRQYLRSIGVLWRASR